MYRLLAIFALLLAPTFAAAQSAAQELLRLVPDDVGLCLLVNDLRGNAQKLADTRWVKALMQSPLGQALRATPELAKLQKVNQDLKSHLQIDWPQFRDEILGQAVVFAYRPGPDSDPKKEQGLVLVRTSNTKLLAELLDRFQKLQKASGELRELSAVDYKGSVYHRRVDAKGINFYWLNDGLLAFSPQEALIQGVVERSKSSEPSRFVQQMQRAGVSDAFIVLCVNPRAFDSELEKKVDQGEDKDRHVLGVFRRYWSALDAVVVGWKQNENELSATFQGRVNEVPSAVRQLFDQLAAPSELWSLFPDNAIFRMAGRVDFAALAQTLGEFAQPADRQAAVDGIQKLLGALALDLRMDVGPNIGPDMGLCIVAASDGKIPHVITAVAIKPGDKQLDRTVFQAILSAAMWGMVSHNIQHPDKIVMKTYVQDGIEIKYLSNDKTFPAGFEPALALKTGYLLLASHPDAVQHFRKSNGGTLAETPLLHLSLSRLAENLQQRRDDVAALVAEKRGVPKEAVGNVVDAIAKTLSLFDEITVGLRAQTGQITWTMRLAGRNE